METIDDRFGAAVGVAIRGCVADALHVQPKISVAISEVRAGARRRRAVRRAVVAVGTMSLVVVGLTAVVLRNVGTPDQAADQPRSTEPADLLLYPPSLAEADARVTVGPSVVPTSAALLQAPSGALFRVGVSVSSGELTPGAERRVFNGREFDSELYDGIASYQSLSACARVGVVESSPAPRLWDDEALILLDGLVANGKDVSIGVPDGWTSLGAGHPATMLQLTFGATVDGRQIGVNLTQIPSTPVAFLADSKLTPTLIGNRPAWTMENTAFRTLIWEQNGNAVSLSGIATSDELVQIAATLESGHGDTWSAIIPTDADPAPIGRAPDPEPVTPGNCGLSDITIRIG